MHEADVNRGQSLISRGCENLLFEDNAVLGWVVVICVLNWLAPNDFLKLEGLIISEHVKSKSTFSGVVRHGSLNDEGVAFLNNRKFDILKLHIVEGNRRFGTLVSLLHDLNSHVI